MSAISYALSELYHVLDRSLLEQSYLQTATSSSVGQSTCAALDLDAAIVDQTLYGRVLPDINLFGGMQKHLCSAHGLIVHEDNWGTVFHYTDESLQGHTIMSCQAFFPGMTCLDGVMPNMSCALAGSPFPYTTIQSTGTAMASTLNGLARRLASTRVQGPQAIVTPRVVAHNSIIIERARLPNVMGMFKVIVSHDDALNDLPPTTWPTFSVLFTTAVKAHIYQTLRSRILKGALFYGQEYNIYIEMIQEFADAEAEYKELRKVWSKVAYTNDKQRYSSFIRMQTRSL